MSYEIENRKQIIQKKQQAERLGRASRPEHDTANLQRALGNEGVEQLVTAGQGEQVARKNGDQVARDSLQGILGRQVKPGMVPAGTIQKADSDDEMDSEDEAKFNAQFNQKQIATWGEQKNRRGAPRHGGNIIQPPPSEHEQEEFKNEGTESDVSESDTDDESVEFEQEVKNESQSSSSADDRRKGGWQHSKKRAFMAEKSPKGNMAGGIRGGKSFLMSKEKLEQVAGRPKKWTFLSKTYRTILNQLEVYHQSRINNSFQLDRPEVWSYLIDQLQALEENCLTYISSHKADDRSEHITALLGQIVNERTMLSAKRRLKQLESEGTFETSLFHGTGSRLLPNLGGELLSGKHLEDRGLVRNTGEGDFFSRAKEGDVEIGEKDFISVGQDTPGLGIAATYAQAAATDKNYNPARYTDALLHQELAQLNDIIENYDERLNQVPNDDIMGARKNLGQFVGLRKKLLAEVTLRENLPHDHPRRQGKKYSESTYPLMFEFSIEGLKIGNPRKTDIREEKKSPTALGAERQVLEDPVNLADPIRLRRVYCPLENMAEVKARLTEIFHHDQLEIIPFEAIEALESIQHAKQLTIGVLESQYEKMRTMVLHAYAKGMKEGTPIDKTALQRICEELGWSIYKKQE